MGDGIAGGGGGRQDKIDFRLAFAPGGDKTGGGHHFADADGMNPDRLGERGEPTLFLAGENPQALPKLPVKSAATEQMDKIKGQIESEKKRKNQVVNHHPHIANTV